MDGLITTRRLLQLIAIIVSASILTILVAATPSTGRKTSPLVNSIDTSNQNIENLSQQGNELEISNSSDDTEPAGDSEKATTANSESSSSKIRISISSGNNTSVDQENENSKLEENPEAISQSNIEINGQSIELDERGRANETIRDEDSKIKVRIHEDSSSEGSSSLNISVDGETN